MAPSPRALCHHRSGTTTQHSGLCSEWLAKHGPCYIAMALLPAQWRTWLPSSGHREIPRVYEGLAGHVFAALALYKSSRGTRFHMQNTVSGRAPCVPQLTLPPNLFPHVPDFRRHAFSSSLFVQSLHRDSPLGMSAVRTPRSSIQDIARSGVPLVAMAAFPSTFVLQFTYTFARQPPPFPAACVLRRWRDASSCQLYWHFESEGQAFCQTSSALHRLPAQNPPTAPDSSEKDH